jgi:hypothetical protein
LIQSKSTTDGDAYCLAGSRRRKTKSGKTRKGTGAGGCTVGQRKKVTGD